MNIDATSQGCRIDLTPAERDQLLIRSSWLLPAAAPAQRSHASAEPGL
jgi:hypothetical protein